MPTGVDHGRWKGGKINAEGYVDIWTPLHPRRSMRGYVREHILIVEKAVGRFILSSECVHHIDGDRANNDIGNLMVFKTHVMHRAFHHRLRAFKASGHWDWRKCKFCKKYDDPKELYVPISGAARHRQCFNEYRRNLTRG